MMNFVREKVSAPTHSVQSIRGVGTLQPNDAMEDENPIVYNVYIEESRKFFFFFVTEEVTRWYSMLLDFKRTILSPPRNFCITKRNPKYIQIQQPCSVSTQTETIEQLKCDKKKSVLEPHRPATMEKKRWNKHSEPFRSSPYVLGHVRHFHWYFLFYSHYSRGCECDQFHEDEQKPLEDVCRHHIQLPFYLYLDLELAPILSNWKMLEPIDQPQEVMRPFMIVFDILLTQNIYMRPNLGDTIRMGSSASK